MVGVSPRYSARGPSCATILLSAFQMPAGSAPAAVSWAVTDVLCRAAAPRWQCTAGDIHIGQQRDGQKWAESQCAPE
jgi:hypothetical protein